MWVHEHVGVTETSPHAVWQVLSNLDEWGSLRFSHRLEPLQSGGTKVIHRLEITGPAAESVAPKLGPTITDDFPEAMAALLARASS
jgi:hypothetical protein